MSAYPPHHSAPTRSTRGDRPGRQRWFWWALAAVVAVLLLIFAAPLVVLLALVLLIVGIVKWVRSGRAPRPGASRPQRGPAITLTAASAVLLVVAMGVTGAQNSQETTPVAGLVANTVPDARSGQKAAESPSGGASSGTRAAAPAQETLAGRLGQSCGNDREAVTLGQETIYCDPDQAGALVWVSAADHADATKKAAEAKRAADKVAADKKIAAQKSADHKRADHQAASKKAAAKKSQAERAATVKAEQKKATARKKAAAAKAEEEQAANLPSTEENASVYYQNCTAVRDAGADPIRSGDPGYSRKLDRDGDGIACE